MDAVRARTVLPSECSPERATAAQHFTLAVRRRIRLQFCWLLFAVSHPVMAALAGSNAELHQASSRINTTICQFFAGCHSDERCSSDARKAWRGFNAKLKKDLNALTSLPYPPDPNCIPRFLENTVRNLLQYRPSAHGSMSRNELEVAT